MRAMWKRESPELVLAWQAKFTRSTAGGTEHDQTMIRVLKTVFAPRLQELARQVEFARAQQVQKNRHPEHSMWKRG